MRTISERQEQILRAVHHDFKGLSQADAAKVLGISQQTVCKELALMKKLIPQMFPILTQMEVKYTHYYDVEGWTGIEIAEYFEVEPSIVYKTVQRAHKKVGPAHKNKDRVSKYDPNMDDDIKEQF